MKQLIKHANAFMPTFSLILSIIVAWVLFPITSGFPIIAFVIFFIGLSSLIYKIKIYKTWHEHILYMGIISLSFFTIYRANEFLLFFDFISIIFFISVLARPYVGTGGMFNLMLSPLTVFFNTIFAENTFSYKLTRPILLKNNNHLKYYLATIITTIIVFLITIPLLASANPLFNNIIQGMLNWLKLDYLWHIFTFESLVINIFRIIILVFLAYMIPRALSVTLNGVKEYHSLPTFPINYFIPKIALAGILIVFFITQLQLYFATPELLQKLGYTNSRLTNEVFIQVTLVAFIVLMLAYLDKSRQKWNTRITYFLILQAFFLISIAFKSVYDYSSLYGFTEKRLWGYASMTWLSGVLITYICHYYKQSTVQAFIKQMLAFSIIVIITINLLNFDYLIYHTAKPTTQAGIDYTYISKRSVDANFINDLLPKFINDIQSDSTIDQSKTISAKRMIRTVSQLRYKYAQKIPVNSFNFAEYNEYLETKSIDIQAYEKIIQDKEQEQMNKDQSFRLPPTP